MKKEQQKYILLGLIIVIFLYGYFKFMLLPINKSIATKKQKLTEVTQELAKAISEANRLEQLKLETAQLELEVKELEKKLPRTKEVPDLLRRVTRNMQRFGIKVNSFAPKGTSSSPEGYDEILYQLQIIANFHSLGHFLASIGQEERLLATRELVLSAYSSADKSQTISGSFNLIAYVFKE